MIVHRRARVLACALLVALSLALVGCSDNEPESSPAELLAQAKRKLDAASSARFALTSSGVPPGSASLVGGKGVLVRPDKFRGELEVSIGSTLAEVSVISVGGTVYAKLPFASSYARTNPQQFGLGDPGELMDPEKGLSTLLLHATSSRLAGKARVGGDVVQEVVATVPGRVVEDLLVSADPSKPVTARFGLTEDNGELRRVRLTGPFFKAGVNSTLTIILDRYGQKVTITAPAEASPSPSVSPSP